MKAKTSKYNANMHQSYTTACTKILLSLLSDNIGIMSGSILNSVVLTTWPPCFFVLTNRYEIAIICDVLEIDDIFYFYNKGIKTQCYLVSFCGPSLFSIQAFYRVFKQGRVGVKIE